MSASSVESAGSVNRVRTSGSQPFAFRVRDNISVLTNFAFFWSGTFLGHLFCHGFGGFKGQTPINRVFVNIPQKGVRGGSAKGSDSQGRPPCRESTVAVS